jgi:putative toxin-antitoxin system antitoxin component (TIGR02293 family)
MSYFCEIKILMMEISDPFIAYKSTDDGSVFSLIEMIRNGIKFPAFNLFAARTPFSMAEWSSFLHISDRTMQRYSKEKRTFDPLQSEKIVEIALLFNKGTEVFGETNKFNSWLETENLALGKIKPKMLLDNTFGIGLLKDELTRIEYGILV